MSSSAQLSPNSCAALPLTYSPSSPSNNPYAPSNRVRSVSEQRRRRRVRYLYSLAATATMALLFVLTARGYHRNHSRRTELLQAVEYIQEHNHKLYDQQLDMVRLNSLRGAQVSTRESLENGPVATAPTLENKEDSEASSTLDWMSETLGVAAEHAGELVHQPLESVLGPDLVDSLAETFHTGLDSVGQVLDENLGSWFYDDMEDYDDEEDDDEEQTNTDDDQENDESEKGYADGGQEEGGEGVEEEDHEDYARVE